MHFRDIQSQYQALRPTQHPLDALNTVTETFTGHRFRGRLEELLTRDNAKTIKGEKQGYLTGILYLAPNTEIPGLNLCPRAHEAGCPSLCLYRAGRGRYHKTQLARIRKTLLFYLEPAIFFAMLKADLHALMAQALMANQIPAVRLNGTSDLLWERLKDPTTNRTILQLFPELQFYDYTKLWGRQVPENYYLTLSYSEATVSFQRQMVTEAHRTGMNLAVVFDRKPFPTTFLGRRVIDGDTHDLRFLDPQGVIVALTAKGPAKKAAPGFVLPQDRFSVDNLA